MKRDCGDCGAKPGELHDPGCDIERCLLCGGQAIGCSCIYELNGMPYDSLEQDHPDIFHEGPTEEMYERFDEEVERLGGRLPWTGEYPDSQECRDFGLYCYWGLATRRSRSTATTFRTVSGSSARRTTLTPEKT